MKRMSNLEHIRSFFIFFILLLLYSFIVANLYFIQIKHQNFYTHLADKQYNISITSLPERAIIYDKNGGWDGSNYFGASLLCLDKLAKQYNYSLIYCNANGVNCFFVHNNILKNKNLQIKNLGDIEKIYRPARYGYGPYGGHIQDPYNRQFICFDEAMQL